jgi:hypothetical protein
MYERARCAMAVYVQAPGTQTRAAAERAVRAISGGRTVCGAWGKLMRANLAAADGERRQAVAYARAAKDQFLSSQAILFARYAELRMHMLRRDESALREVDDTLRQQGIADPTRWVWGKAPYLS